MARFDTVQLLKMINLKGDLPSGRFADQDLLDLAYDCLLSKIVPEVLSAREDYFVTYQDFPITAGQAGYVIPYRAMYGKLREVKVIRGTTVVDLDRKDLEDIRTIVQGSPQAFYMADDSVMLYPTPVITQDTLRLFYYIRPSKLVTVPECAQITAISGNQISITIPTGWATTNTFDLVRGRGRFDILAFDLTATAVASGTVTLTNAVPSTVQVGDFITLAEQTCFPYLPPEFHVALTEYSYAAALRSIGDANAQAASNEADKLIQAAQFPIKTRVDGEPKILGRRFI
jgi:hypothetical protein